MVPVVKTNSRKTVGTEVARFRCVPWLWDGRKGLARTTIKTEEDLLGADAALAETIHWLLNYYDGEIKNIMVYDLHKPDSQNRYANFDCHGNLIKLF